jgi:YHS domain-containing protein
MHHNHIKHIRLIIAFSFIVFTFMIQSIPAKETQTTLGVSGYDVVSYFVDNKAELGNPSHVYQYKGVNFWFSSDKHKSLFVINALRYLPQYDGYCAYGVLYEQQLYEEMVKGYN